MAKWTPEALEKRKWDRLIESAKAKGEGLMRDGEMIVHPARERVPAIRATRV